MSIEQVMVNDGLIPSEHLEDSTGGGTGCMKAADQKNHLREIDGDAQIESGQMLMEGQEGTAV